MSDPCLGSEAFELGHEKPSACERMAEHSEQESEREETFRLNGGRHTGDLLLGLFFVLE